MVNYKKEIWEGWTIEDFINYLKDEIDMIMSGESYKKPFTNKEELKIYIVKNQPYYKKPIPEVIEYFSEKYCLN